MPVPQLKSYSEKYKIPFKKVEEFWNKAKEQYGEDWEAVSGTVKKMCQNYKKGQDNMNESLTDVALKFKGSNIDKSLKILREEKVPTYSKAKIKQMIKDGKCEVNTGDIETVRPGSHIELRMFPSKKVKTVQVESIQMNEDVFAEIAELTSDNNHSEALVRGAEYVAEVADGKDLKKAEGFVETFKIILAKHKRAGELTPQLSSERNKEANDFFKFAKTVLSPEDFKKLNKSY